MLQEVAETLAEILLVLLVKLVGQHPWVLARRRMHRLLLLLILPALRQWLSP